MPDAGDGFDVRSLAVTYREGHVVTAHSHPWAQLIYATTGLLHVEADDRIWFVPPTKAVWLPPFMDHRLAFKGDVALRTLYISRERAADFQANIATLEVSTLLSALIQHIVALHMLDPHVPEHDHLACVLMDLIRAAPKLDTVLPQPKDKRALRLADHLREHPTDKRDLGLLAREFGASLRTMQRYFSADTGMPLDAWRQKARLVHSVAALSAGASVAEAANGCGYESPSAFVVAFKKHFGVTPGRFETGLD